MRHSVGCVHLDSIVLPAVLGFTTGLSLIVAIGAQNAFVLRLGIEASRRNVFFVVLLCALSDAVLIISGVLGIGVVIHRAPAALLVVRIIGVAFLVAYGVLAAKRALSAKNGSLETGDSQHATQSLATVLATAAAFTWLNPHVYLDTVVFLGSLANQQGISERWWWAAGAILASFVWFFALGFCARLLRPLFAKPAAWRVLDGAIAVTMIGLAVKLAFGA